MGKIKNAILLFVVSFVTIITFSSQYTSLLKDIESTAKTKEAQISRYADLGNGFIDLLTIYGNDFFKHSAPEDNVLYKHLKYDPSTESYNLDMIRGTEYQAVSGSLTGMGQIPDNGVNKNEINLALYFNQDFSSVYKKLPDIAWIYYTSKNNFINIYPWVSSKDFAFNKSLQSEKFYTYVTPDQNPLRKSVWTPVYLDHAGKGLMVTLSSPIYDGNTFMGAVSLDLCNNQLNEILDSSYETYLVDGAGSVMATTRNIKFDKDVIKFNTLISDREMEKISGIHNNEITLVGNYYVYSVDFNNAPWKMYFRVPIFSVVVKSVVYTLPVFVICVLFLLSFIESEKRRKTELQLKDSLKELTSYHTLLENAAKYDFLTSTVNRRGLVDIFTEDFESDPEANKSIVFIMGDIDHFKQFNDTYGHAAGDKVLMEISSIMQNNVSSDDVVCRWGGEEFVIMLLNRTYEQAISVAENIRKKIESTVIPWENSVELRGTMTFGVAKHSPTDSIYDSISKADAAMYVGKEKQRNQVVGYNDLP
ncbi:MAG: diguanylate cyclase [Bacillota bacterium]|nr:diguanylate cyclase [Bacillota bacterium]